MHKRIICILASAIILAVLFITAGLRDETGKLIPESNPPPIVNETPTVIQPEELSERTATTAADTIRVEIIAGTNRYSVTVPHGSNVYDAMVFLDAMSTFRFRARYYSELGYFIEEINGTKNAGGTYWTLYVNGEYSIVGASAHILEDGDKVEWRYERK